MATGTPGTDARYYHTAQVHYLRRAVTFEDTTVEVGILPAGAVVTDAYAVTDTAFNAGTTAVFDIGTSTTADRFVADADVSAAGKDAGTLGSDLFLDSDTIVEAAYTETGTAATAGAGVIIVEFVVDNDR